MSKVWIALRGNSLRSVFSGWIALGAFLLLPTLGHAGLIGTNVTVRLNSPGDGIDASKVATVVDPGVEVSPSLCTASEPDCNMLTGASFQEYIDFKDGEIDLRILAGGTGSGGQLVTGFGSGAVWELSNLHPLNQIITGITFSLGAGQVLVGPQVVLGSSNDLITVSLDDIIFAPVATGQSDAHADVRITLLTEQTPNGNVPEPGSSLLLAAALVSALGVRRLRKRSAQRWSVA